MDLRERAKQAALAAADWYVNSQVRMQKPYWDANHGRHIYNRHIPTGRTVLGISWTMGRAIMVLGAAYELTGQQKYLDSARLAASYILNLQVMDPREPRAYGAIREEIPQVAHVNCRDSAEAAAALMHLYRLTGDEEYLYRTRLWANWFLANCLDETGWPFFSFYIYENRRILDGKFFQYGGIFPFIYLYKATGIHTYLERGVVAFTNIFLQRYLRPDGAIKSSEADGHHAGAGGTAVNDDGCGCALIATYQLTSDQRCLDASVRYGDWLSRQPVPDSFGGRGIRAMTLYDLATVTGEKKYRDAADRLLETLLPLQVLDADDPAVRGAFRGEDEPIEWYDGKSPEDFVVNRTTAYAALACFRCHGEIIGPYYGLNRWDAPVKGLAREAILAGEVDGHPGKGYPGGEERVAGAV